MRWIPFLIFAYLFVLVQVSLGGILVFERLAIGPVGPDFAVLLAVFIALHVRRASDGMLAGWCLGLMLDLTTAGAAGAATRVGPMAVSFALAVGIVFSLREAIFRERALPQIFVAALFCLISHAMWVSIQSLLGPDTMTWQAYGRMLLQVLLSAAYTGLLMPLAHFILSPCRNWLMISPPPRPRRTRPNLRKSR